MHPFLTSPVSICDFFNLNSLATDAPLCCNKQLITDGTAWRDGDSPDTSVRSPRKIFTFGVVFVRLGVLSVSLSLTHYVL